MDAKALVRQMIVTLATDPSHKLWEGEYNMVVKAVRIAYPTLSGDQPAEFADRMLAEYLGLILA